MSIEIENIDSFLDHSHSMGVREAFNLQHLQSRINDIAHSSWNRKIYLVSPELMDILYPPDKYKGIDIDDVIIADSVELPKRQKKYKNRIFIAIGVYIPKFKPSKYLKKKYVSNYINISDAIEHISEPAIFICPERIMDATSVFENKPYTFRSILNWEEVCFSEEESEVTEYDPEEICDKVYDNIIEFNALFVKVCLHEIAHHYMNLDKKTKGKKVKVDKVYYKFIEESLANIFAWSQFSDPKEKAIIEKFMDSQPLEYSAYRYWINNGKLKKCVPLLISAWKHKVDPFVPEYTFSFMNELLSEHWYYSDEYSQLIKSDLNFDLENKRSQNWLVNKLKEEKNLWYAIVKSMLIDYKNKSYLH